MANLVVNGSFEKSHITNPRKWDYFPKGSLLPWHTDAAMFELWTDGCVIQPHQPCYSVSDGGKQNLEILSKGPPNPLTSAAVWQSVPTVVGKTYAFSFYHTPRAGHHSILTVRINDYPICTFNEDGTGFEFFNWMKFTINFIAAHEITKLSFHDQANSGAGTHIDDVVLEKISPLMAGALQTF